MNLEELRDAVASELPDAPIVVALGGGADSAVAAWACSKHYPARAVFVHHGLAASPALLDAAGELSETVGLELTVVPAPVDPGPNLESRARDARWDAIRSGLAAGEIVVTGHTQDDLAETVLINLLRGAGARGLAALSTGRSDTVRPLIAWSRTDLRSAAEHLGLPFIDDPANADPAFLRNRIRSDLVPLLDREFRSGVRGTLARAARNLAADDAVLESEAQGIPFGEVDGALLLPVPVLETVTRPLAARAVQRALRRLHPPYGGSGADVDTVFFVAAGANRKATLTSGVSIAREGPHVALWVREPRVPEPAALPAPGSIRFGSHRIEAAPALAGGPVPRSTLLLDPAVFQAGVTVRPAAIGERIDIDHGTKLVRDALAEAGIPLRRRPAWPVVANDGKIAAIVGVRAAPWARPAGSDAIAVTGEQL